MNGLIATFDRRKPPRAAALLALASIVGTALAGTPPAAASVAAPASPCAAEPGREAPEGTGGGPPGAAGLSESEEATLASEEAAGGTGAVAESGECEGGEAEGGSIAERSRTGTVAGPGRRSNRAGARISALHLTGATLNALKNPHVRASQIVISVRTSSAASLRVTLWPAGLAADATRSHHSTLSFIANTHRGVNHIALRSHISLAAGTYRLSVHVDTAPSKALGFRAR